MRITNRIIQNNSLTNINNNKVLQDTLSTQIATEKKIARPSDDPIIALRSLRLRTSVNQTEQYLQKNAADAKSWLQVTEDAITTLSDIITDIRKQYVKGTSDTLKREDREIILENLQALSAEIYNTGNADFAGRSVFTGFRTDSDLTFQKQETLAYGIQETWNSEEGGSLKVDSITHVYYEDGLTGKDETKVSSSDITRIRLSYDNLMKQDISLTISAKGATNTYTATAQTDPYDYIKNNPSGVCFDASTGEIFLGSEVVASPDEIADVTVGYGKNSWVKGDLRPEHYFNCTSTSIDEHGVSSTINYSLDSSNGEIVYNIGVNQSLRINTTAGECFTHDIKRDLDDIVIAINDVNKIEDTVTELEKKLAGLTEGTAEYDEAKLELDAAKKAETFLNDKLSKIFGHGITNAEGYLTKNNLALTNCGTRSKRLELIENRLDTQLSTLRELKSENEDVDMAEIAVKLTSAEYAYNASLMATSKILQESLLNYL
jgi:flagellar hook-associated protein 3 FlgL